MGNAVIDLLSAGIVSGGDTGRHGGKGLGLLREVRLRQRVEEVDWLTAADIQQLPLRQVIEGQQPHLPELVGHV